MATSLKEQIDEALRNARMMPGITNKAVLGVNIQAIQTAKNGGYPKHMYHETGEPVVITNENEEQAMARLGYVTNYIRHAYPRMKFRRNMSPRFAVTEDQIAQQLKTGGVLPPDHVEQITVASEAQDRALTARPTPKGCGKWVDRLDDLEPLPDQDPEEAGLTIARLQGRLEEAERRDVPKAAYAKG